MGHFADGYAWLRNKNCFSRNESRQDFRRSYSKTLDAFRVAGNKALESPSFGMRPAFNIEFGRQAVDSEPSKRFEIGPSMRFEPV